MVGTTRAPQKGTYMSKHRFLACLIVPACTLALLRPASATAAQDFFLKLDGIPGESTDDQHEDEIDVLSFLPMGPDGRDPHPESQVQTSRSRSASTAPARSCSSAQPAAG